jgi:hypothetical protein
VNGAAIIAGAGHHFIHRGTETAKALCVLTPGVPGPAYFRGLATLVSASGPPDPARMSETARRHGLVPVPG